MAFNKHRFTATPQQDSEGFTDYQAVCVGCGPTEPCWRSGHCERYDSPLRFLEPSVIVPPLRPAEDVLTVDVGAMIEAHEAARESNALVLEDGREMPYCEQCQCWHFPSAGHTADISRRAIEDRMDERARHEAWVLGQQAKGDKLRAADLPVVELPNPTGWNEPGMQPIADYGWADLEATAVRNGRAE